MRTAYCIEPKIFRKNPKSNDKINLISWKFRENKAAKIRSNARKLEGLEKQNRAEPLFEAKNFNLSGRKLVP